MSRSLCKPCVALLLVLLLGSGGCAKSRAEMVRDHAAVVEKKLEAARDGTLHSADPASAKEQQISHLQTLRLGLSMVNISLASVPVMLRDEAQRNIGYSILDEALGTIDWNIPLYQQQGGQAAGPRPYPSLFSPQSGLDFTSIQAGARPGSAGPNNVGAPPGIAR